MIFLNFSPKLFFVISRQSRIDFPGALHQNRFKSILCDKEEYLLQLIRYIHLNPLRAGLVQTLGALDKSLWTGHAVLLGNKEAEWLNTEEVLSHFARTKRKARAEYREFVKEGIGQEQPIDLSGGGLIRSMGGVWEVIKASRKGHKEAGDERILGSGDFVEAVLKRTEEQESAASKLQREGWDFEKVLQRVAEKLSITRAAVGALVNRGREIEAQLGLGIVDEL